MSYSLSTPSTFLAAPSPSSFSYACYSSPSSSSLGLSQQQHHFTSSSSLNMSLDQEVQLMYDHFEQVGLQCLDVIRVIGLWIFPIFFITSNIFALVVQHQDHLWRFLFMSSLSPFSSASSKKHLVLLRHVLNDILDESTSTHQQIEEEGDQISSNPKTETNTNQNKTQLQHDQVFRSSAKSKTTKSNHGQDQPLQKPRHIAVIMDGNRRYGKEKLGSSLLGHRVGGERLREFVRWCRTAEIEMLTVYAFSTENWNRPKQEVDLLMDLFSNFFNQMLLDAEEIGIRIRFISSEPEKLPDEIRELMRKVELHTRQFGSNDEGKSSICVNVCASYGSRSSIVKSCEAVISMGGKNCRDEKKKTTTTSSTENLLIRELGTSFLEREEEQEQEQGSKKKNPFHDRDIELWSSPDILIRTSGEIRLSNFMLLELAYSEMFFWKCTWPEVTEEMLNGCLNEFSENRQRRMGK